MGTQSSGAIRYTRILSSFGSTDLARKKLTARNRRSGGVSKVTRRSTSIQKPRLPFETLLYPVQSVSLLSFLYPGSRWPGRRRQQGSSRRPRLELKSRGSRDVPPRFSTLLNYYWDTGRNREGNSRKLSSVKIRGSQSTESISLRLPTDRCSLSVKGFLLRVESIEILNQSRIGSQSFREFYTEASRDFLSLCCQGYTVNSLSAWKSTPQPRSKIT